MTSTAPPQGGFRYLRPPLTLSITLAEPKRDQILIDVKMLSGEHCYLHRALAVRPDACDELPAIVESHLYEWIKYLCDSDRARRTTTPGCESRIRGRSPAWPTPGDAHQAIGADQGVLDGI